MLLKARLTIPSPEFARFESVTLHWDGETLDTAILARWYNLDNECWFYLVAGRASLYTADVLERYDRPFSA